MTREEFWNIIKRSEGISDPETINEVNKAELEKLTPEEIVSYKTHFNTLVDKASRWDLWGAIYIINGGCGDDSFIDFRYSLISMGEDIYTRAVQDPDSLVELDLDTGDDDTYERVFNEAFGYVAMEVYEEKTREDIYDYLPNYSEEEEMGEEWDFDDREECMKRLPNLTQKYWPTV